jgi:FKBP-type peptidyl-prolyl cis-trans isomerase
LIAGILDTLAGTEPRLNDEEMTKAFEEINKMLAGRAEAATKDNMAKANEFLEKNKKAEGVIALPSGLQYKVVKQGAGAQPKLTSEVKVHYEGKLLNGKVFDSSIARGEPISFPVSGVIKGWTEALQRMKVGDKWILFIPPGLAYGERGAGGDIGPNEMLIFEVELLDVKN